MSRVSDEYRVADLVVLPWTEPDRDASGYDPRSDYVEQFWLPLMGPSTVLLLRRLAMGLDRWPDGFECSTQELSLSLGLGPHGGRGSLGRVIRRAGEFGMTSMEADGRLLALRLLPPLPARMLRRLPEWLQDAHRLHPGTAVTASVA